MAIILHQCPQCRFPVSLTDATHCRSCQAQIEWRPEFLGSLTSRIVFLVMGTFLGGLVLSVRNDLGMVEYDGTSFMLDLMIGLLYVWFCKLLFRFFQRPFFR